MRENHTDLNLNQKNVKNVVDHNITLQKFNKSSLSDFVHIEGFCASGPVTSFLFSSCNMFV